MKWGLPGRGHTVIWRYVGTGHCGSLWVLIGHDGSWWVLVGLDGSLWVMVGACGCLWVTGVSHLVEHDGG